MTFPLIYNDGWVLGADGLTPEDLASEKPQRTEKNDAFDINLMMSKIRSDNRSGSNSSSRNENGRKAEKIEVAPEGTVIVKGKNVVISEYRGAIIVQQRYVKRRTVVRNIPVIRKRNGEITKEKMTQKITENPYTVMIPAMYRDNPVDYLKSVKPKNGGKKVIKEAIELLS